MSYNPDSLIDRRRLAEELTAALVKAKFVKVSVDTTEDVWEFVVPQVQNTRIVVFSSIYHGSARANGTDAIRVAVLYKTADGQNRSLISQTRVHRTGTIEGIVQRTLDRMRASYAQLRDRHNSGRYTCQRCKAPFFKSKRGFEVCAAACWTKGENS